MDVRLRTCLILRKDGMFLVGWDPVMEQPKWSTSAWDAWRTRDRIRAAMVAERLDAEIWMFNPVAAQLRPRVPVSR